MSNFFRISNSKFYQVDYKNLTIYTIENDRKIIS